MEAGGEHRVREQRWQVRQSVAGLVGAGQANDSLRRLRAHGMGRRAARQARGQVIDEARGAGDEGLEQAEQTEPIPQPRGPDVQTVLVNDTPSSEGTPEREKEGWETLLGNNDIRTTICSQRARLGGLAIVGSTPAERPLELPGRHGLGVVVGREGVGRFRHLEDESSKRRAVVQLGKELHLQVNTYANRLAPSRRGDGRSTK